MPKYSNIYKVTKSQNITLPNLGDQFQVKKRLDYLIEKLYEKFETYQE